MYKIILVDDNKRDLRGIQSILTEFGDSVQVVGTFSNGQSCLDALPGMDVDILITDVMMPVLDGIGLSEQVKKLYPHIKIIFTSAYNNFDYAKSALEVNAYGYVLKPIIKAELCEKVRRIIDELREEERARTERRELTSKLEKALPTLRDQFLRDLLFGEFDDWENVGTYGDLFKIEFPDSACVVVSTFEIHNSATNNPIKESYLISLSIKRFFEYLHEQQVYHYLLQLNHKQFVGIFIRGSGDIFDTIVEVKERISAALGVAIRMGTSSVGYALSALPILYKQSLIALDSEYTTNEDTFVLYEEIAKNLAEDQANTFQDMRLEIDNCISSGSRQEIEAFLDRFFPETADLDISKSNAFSAVSMIVFSLNNCGKRNPFNESIKWDELIEAKDIEGIRRFLAEMLIRGADRLTDNGYGRDQTVTTIKRYIQENYAKRISIDEIAGQVNFSSVYANKIYKNQTQETIFEYLTRYRMERAKEMLKDPSSRIYLVAADVGYANKSHFCLKFKQYTGLSPADYKNSW